LKYPGLLISGRNYPLPPLRALLSKFVGFVQIAILFITIGGNFIGIVRNHWVYRFIEQHKMAFVLGGFIGLNFVQNMISSTGAFEVLFNG